MSVGIRILCSAVVIGNIISTEETQRSVNVNAEGDLDIANDHAMMGKPEDDFCNDFQKLSELRLPISATHYVNATCEGPQAKEDADHLIGGTFQLHLHFHNQETGQREASVKTAAMPRAKFLERLALREAVFQPGRVAGKIVRALVPSTRPHYDGTFVLHSSARKTEPLLQELVPDSSMNDARLIQDQVWWKKWCTDRFNLQVEQIQGDGILGFDLFRISNCQEYVYSLDSSTLTGEDWEHRVKQEGFDGLELTDPFVSFKEILAFKRDNPQSSDDPMQTLRNGFIEHWEDVGRKDKWENLLQKHCIGIGHTVPVGQWGVPVLSYKMQGKALVPVATL